MTDSIFALATAPGRAAVAVIRLSGPDVPQMLEAIGAGGVEPRRASLRWLRDLGGKPLDRALVLWFPGPASFTGEDAAELHLHGGRAIIESVMAVLAGSGLRLAEPGEFTRRAFQNGKLDLGEAEAVADLVDAESAAQARQALGQMSGALSHRYGAWRERLVRILADLEAAVDFPDEDIPAEVEARARSPLLELREDLDLALSDGARGRQIRNGYKVAVVGAPNAGKSSLFNGLIGREAAIVTPLGGTTRDVIEAALDVNGYRIILADMAGVRETADEIETEGVRRARTWAAGADLRLWVIDQAEDDGLWREGVDMIREGDLCVLNKSDLAEGVSGAKARTAAAAMGVEVLTLTLLEKNASPIWDWLADRVVRDLGGVDFPATTRMRHAVQLMAARTHVERALTALDQPELAAEDVRLAARALAAVTGSIGVEDVLDQVFANFCIGK